MKRIAWLLVVVASAVTLTAAWAQMVPDFAARNRYLLITAHSKENCLSSLDEFAAKNPDLLAKADWGCKVNHHVGYVIVPADDEKDALAQLPPSQRDNAKAILMTRYTPEKLQEIHRRKGI